MKKPGFLLLPLLPLLPLLLGAGGAAPRLILPIDCKLGVSCAIQNYVDLDPSSGARDYRCGSRTYDAHNGVDFRLTSMAQQRRGVDVLAAADGVVLRVRDGVSDISVKAMGAASVANIQCGNGLVIDHGDGFESQYCHMAKGSIAVRAGERVSAGAVIGRVGLSGNTEYPHLHFTLRKDGTAIEPFAFGGKPGQCGDGRSLWSPTAGVTNAYRAGEVLNAGFATGPVSMAMVQEAGAHPSPRPNRTAPALVAFVQVIGLRAGDTQTLRLVAPDGSAMGENRAPRLDRDKAQWLLFVGKKRPSEGWFKGRYTARYDVIRGGKIVIQKIFAVEL